MRNIVPNPDVPEVVPRVLGETDFRALKELFKARGIELSDQSYATTQEIPAEARPDALLILQMEMSNKFARLDAEGCLHGKRLGRALIGIIPVLALLAAAMIVVLCTLYGPEAAWDMVR